MHESGCEDFIGMGRRLAVVEFVLGGMRITARFLPSELLCARSVVYSGPGVKTLEFALLVLPPGTTQDVLGSRRRLTSTIFVG